MKQLELFIITSSCFICVLSEPDCPSFYDISLYREVSQKGFHRDLTTVLHVNLTEQGITPDFLLRERFPSDFYIDQYQSADAEGFGGPQTIIPIDIDVERPAASSPPFSFYVYMIPEGGAQDQDTLSVTLPIHLRYQSPVAEGGHHTSLLPHPVLAVRCAGPSTETTDSDRYLSVPCSTSREDGPCLWKIIDYQISTQPLEMSVPIGRQDDIVMVTGSTFIIVISCVVLLIYAMCTNHAKEE